MPRRKDVGGARRLTIAADEPCPTVVAGGVGSVNCSQYEVRHTQFWLEDDGMPARKTANDKPSYRVPSMVEVARIPWNGFTVASTFSGCGGSSLGYRMAGFRVLWASEFVKAARDSYRANMRSGTILDGRDVRQVKPEEVLRTMRMQPGQLDLLDGSPPCASFSTAGKRQKGWGQEKKYSDTVQRTDDLFFEFVRLLKGIKPKTFVAENVSGLVKGTAKGYFLMILKELKDSGYRVSCKVLDAQWLGVPQQRQRTIFVGVREDLVDDAGRPLMPCHPSPLPYRYSIRDAIPWIGESFNHNRVEEETSKSSDGPSPSVRGKGAAHLSVNLTSEGPDGAKAKVPLDGPSPTVRAGRNQFIVEAEADMTGLATGAEHDRMGGPGTQSDRYFQLVRPPLDGACPTVTAAGGNPGLASVCHPIERRKFSIAELKRICAFPDDFILTGSYAQQWERLGRAVPPIMMMHVASAVRDGILLKIRKRKGPG